MCKNLAPEVIARVLFEKISDNNGEVAIETWQFRKCPVGKGVLKRKKGFGWSNMSQHAIKHKGWKDKFLAAPSEVVVR